MTGEIVVAGASGFVGRALTARLASDGYRVRALSRSGGDAGPGVVVERVDVGDEDAAARALEGARAAYYLVHSMAAGPEFRDRDLRLAEVFGRAASRAGVGRIVYLGGLGRAPQSEHLASRHEVGAALAAAGTPLIELRAAVIFGAGGISFEMLRYLAERLPVMVCPRWVRTRIQPLALADLLDYLVQSLEAPAGVYEVGGADVTTYREMIGEYARVRGLRRRLILDIPWLTPRLSSYWVDIVTPVDRRVSHALVESLVTEVVVTDPRPTLEAFTVEPMGVADALRAALDHQDADVTRTLFERATGLQDGVYCTRGSVQVSPAEAAAVARDLHRVGGDLRWYGAAPGWRLRLLLGRVVGERLGLHAPDEPVSDALVDWWRIARIGPDELVLRSVGWKPGDAWLGYRIHGGRLHQVAAFRPLGAPGFLYWKLLVPVHRLAFAAMLRNRLRRAEGGATGLPPG